MDQSESNQKVTLLITKGSPSKPKIIIFHLLCVTQTTAGTQIVATVSPPAEVPLASIHYPPSSSQK